MLTYVACKTIIIRHITFETRGKKRGRILNLFLILSGKKRSIVGEEKYEFEVVRSYLLEN